MKKVAGIIMIAVGGFLDVGYIWALSVGGDVVGSIVLIIVGLLLLIFGIKLVKSKKVKG